MIYLFPQNKYRFFKTIFTLVAILTFYISTSFAQYCTPSSNNYNYLRYITWAEIGELYNDSPNGWSEINNASGDDNGYGNYTGMTADVFPGREFQIRWNLNYEFLTEGYAYAAYIDWNNDGDFNDPDEEIANVADAGQPPFNISVVVPKDQPLGTYRLRIMSASPLTGSAPVALDACSSDNSEYEDYSLNVTNWTVANPPLTNNGSCGNVGFDSQNFSQWDTWTGAHPEACNYRGGVFPCNPSCCMTSDEINYGIDFGPGVGVVGGNWVESRHTIVTPGGDPLTVPIQRVPPWGGTNAARLGSEEAGQLAEKITKTIHVNANAPNITYGFAIVMNEPGHASNEQPYFLARMIDGNGNVIPCSFRYVQRGTSYAFIKMTNPSDPRDEFSFYYRDWEQIFVDLSDYIGQDVTLEFTTSDCARGAHFLYAYVDVVCEPITINPTVTTVCEGESVTLTAPTPPASGNFTYLWSPGGETTPSITVTPIIDTSVYTVSMFPEFGCPLDVTDTVIVVQPIEFSNVISACNGDGTYTLTFGVTGGDGNYNVGGVTGTLTGGIVQTFTSDPIPANTPYNITVNDGGGCNPGTLTGTQDCPTSCLAYPLVSAGTTTPLCIGDTYDISDASALDAVDFLSLEDPSKAGLLWTTTGGVTFSDATTTNPTLTATTAGTFTLTITGYSGEADQTLCPDATATVDITVNPQPTVEAGDNATVCAAPHAITSVSATNYNTLSWTHDGAGTLDQTDPLNPVYTPVAADNGNTITLTITATGTAPCTDVTDIVTIDIIPNATAEAGDDGTICSDDTYTITNSAATGYNTLSWTHDGAGSLDDASNITPTYTPTAGDEGNVVTLTLLADATDPCLDATDQVTITVVAPPTVEAGGNGSICEGGTYQITDAAVTNEASFVWTHDGTGSLDNPSIINPTYTPGAGDIGNSVNLTLSVTANSPCTDVTDQMIIDLTGGATAEAGDNNDICSDAPYSIINVSATGYSTATWTHDGAGTLDQTDPLNPIYTPVPADEGNVVTLTLLADADDPCPDATDQVQLNVIASPTVDAGSNGSVCGGTDFTVSDAAVTGSTTYLWTHDGTGSLDDATILNTTYRPTAADDGNLVTMTLTVTANAPCTDVTDQMTIDFTGGATAYAGDDANVCSDGPYNIQNITASGYNTLSWTHTGAGILDDTDPLNPIYTPATADEGTVVTLTLLADATAPCPDASDEVELTIIAPPVIDAGGNGSICESGTYTISDAIATNAVSYFWTHDGAGTLDDATILNPTYTPGLADIGGSVNLTLTVTGNAPCVDIADNMRIDLTGGATAEAGDPSDVCSDATHAIQNVSATGYSTITWTHDGAGTLDDSDPENPIYTPDPADEGNVVTLTLFADADDPCPDATDDVALTIIAPPTVDAGADGMICEGGTYTISDATATDAASYLWTHDGAGTLDDATILNPTYTPGVTDIGGSVNLTLTVTGNAPCGGATDTMTIDLTGAATANAGDDSDVCSDASHTITNVSATGYSTLVWTHDGQGTLDDSDPLNPTYTPTAADAGNVVTLTLLSDATDPCPDATDQVQLTIIAPPTVEAGSDATICQAGTYTVADAVVTNSLNYQWTHDGSGTLDDPTALLPIYTPTPADGGNMVTMTLTVSADAPCADVTDMMQIDVSSIAAANAGDDAEVCAGDSHPITSVTASGAITYVWTHDGQGTLDDSDPLNPIYQSLTTEAGTQVTLTLTVTAPAPCQGSDDQVVLNIIDNPTVDAGDNAEICVSDNHTIQNAVTTNTSTFTWTHDGQGDLQDENTLTPTYVPSPDEAGATVTLTLTAQPITPCTVPVNDMVTIDIATPPTVDAGNIGTICETGTYTISDATATAATTYSWTHDGQGTFDNANQLNPTYTPAGSDIGSIVNVTVTATGSPLCPQATDDNLIRIIAAPEVEAGDPETICLGSTHTLTATSVTDAAYHNWTHDGNGTIDDEYALNPTYTPTNTDAGSMVTFTLTGYPVSPCSQPAVDQVILRIIAPPEVNAGTDDFICANGGTFTISSATAANYSTINWTVVQGDPTHLSDATTLTPSYTPTLAEGGTQVILAVEAAPNSPCAGSARDTMILEIGIVPEFTVTPGEVCPGESITMEIEPINNYDTDMVYDWYTIETGGTIEHTGEHYTTAPLYQSITYYVEPSRGCIGPRVVTDLIVHPFPVAEFTTDTEVIEELETDVNFQDLSIDAATGTWDFGDQTYQGYTPGTDPAHHYSIQPGDVPDSYTIVLNVESDFGCPASAELEIPVDLKWAIYIPKAFTPGDQNSINDDFIPKGFGIVELKMWIFNRWGDNIYFTDQGVPWDGYDHLYNAGKNPTKSSPDMVKQDTYVYKVEILNVFMEKHTYIGEINLIR